MDGHNFERLKAHILPLSVSDRFDAARTDGHWSPGRSAKNSTNVRADKTSRNTAISATASTEARRTLGMSASTGLFRSTRATYLTASSALRRIPPQTPAATS
jgi:hypothetical protein